MSNYPDYLRPVTRLKSRDQIDRWFRNNYHKLDSGGIDRLGNEPNTVPYTPETWEKAPVRILIVRWSDYFSVDVSFTHGMINQLIQELCPGAFVDLSFFPNTPKDFEFYMEERIPIMMGSSSKHPAKDFDIISVSHCVTNEGLNWPSMLKHSGIHLFKNERMQDPNTPLIIMGGANAFCNEALYGTWDLADKENAGLIDATFVGEGEKIYPVLLESYLKSKAAGKTKEEILKQFHLDKVPGYYEASQYEHVYGRPDWIEEKGAKFGTCDYLTKIIPKQPWVRPIVKKAKVIDLDSVKSIERDIIPYTGSGEAQQQIAAGCNQLSGKTLISIRLAGVEKEVELQTLPDLVPMTQVDLVCYDHDGNPVPEAEAFNLDDLLEIKTETGYQPVKTFYKKSIVDTYEIRAKDFHVEVSADHPVRIWERKQGLAMCKSRDLELGDLVVVHLDDLSDVPIRFILDPKLSLGLLPVTELKKSAPQQMYDLTVGAENDYYHRFAFEIRTTLGYRWLSSEPKAPRKIPTEIQNILLTGRNEGTYDAGFSTSFESYDEVLEYHQKQKLGSFEPPKTITKDWALFLGWLAGDGLTCDRYASDHGYSSVTLNLGPDDSKEEIEGLLTRLSLPYGYRKERNVDYYTLHQNVGLRYWLDLIGASGIAHTKRVPWVIRQASAEIKQSWLQAYFGADGGIEKGRSSTYEEEG